MSSERATSLADDLAAVNVEVIEFASCCSEAQWRTVVPGEDWSVGVVIHHIAESHANARRWLESMARGEAVTDTTDDIDARNVDHATRSAGVGVAETIALLSKNGERAEAAIRRLTDEDLDRTAGFGPAEGRELPVEQMAAVTARHARGHLAHAQGALSDLA